MMKNINELSKNDIRDIELIVFDVDGVLVRRGTNIKSGKDFLNLELKSIGDDEINKIRELYKSDCFDINISSGRGLYMLQLMFREVLQYVSLTYENGSATWINGHIIQHVNSYNQLKPVFDKLLSVKNEKIFGWEPKEFIITIHCSDRVNEIEEITNEFNYLYCIWNGEAYDIGIKNRQTKSNGLKNLISMLELERNNVLVIGDNYNDEDLMSIGGISITADKSRVIGDFWVPLNDDKLPANILISKILSIL